MTDVTVTRPAACSSIGAATACESVIDPLLLKSLLIDARRPIRYDFDLQFFADAEDEGRTEDPTDRKKSKARSEGSVPKSRDLVLPISVLVVVLILKYYIPYMIFQMSDMTRYILEHFMLTDITILGVMQLMMLITKMLVLLCLPVMLVASVASIFGHVIQAGWIFTFKPLKPDITKLKPDIKRVLDKFLPKKETLYELFKSVMKVVIIGWFAVQVILNHYADIVGCLKLDLWSALTLIGGVAYELSVKICILLILFSIIDVFWQRHQWTDKMKMTKHEVKDERKQMDGDPQIKSAQRSRMIEMAQRRMMEMVPKANVVITNPTHYAVALKYDTETQAAPTCVAKGLDFLALRIRDLAEKNDVPLYEDRFLARALYEAVEVGDEIPPQFYESVAEVLAFVYRLKEGATA